MATQERLAASENLSGIEIVMDSVNTLKHAGFSQDQSLELAKAISGLISAEMKPFMDQIDKRFKAMEEANKARFDAINVRFEAMEKRLELVERKVDGLQKALVGSVIGLAVVFLSAVAVFLSVTVVP